MIGITAKVRTALLDDHVTRTWFVSYRTPDTPAGWSWTTPDYPDRAQLRAALVDIYALPSVRDVRVHVTTTTVRATVTRGLPARPAA